MLLLWYSWFKYRFIKLDLATVGEFCFHFSRVLSPYSEFKLIGFKTISVPDKFRGKVPPLSMNFHAFRCLTDSPVRLALTFERKGNCL